MSAFPQEKDLVGEIPGLFPRSSDPAAQRVNTINKQIMESHSDPDQNGSLVHLFSRVPHMNKFHSKSFNKGALTVKAPGRTDI